MRVGELYVVREGTTVRGGVGRDGEREGRTGRLAGGQTDRQVGRKIDRQTDRGGGGRERERERERERGTGGDKSLPCLCSKPQTRERVWSPLPSASAAREPFSRWVRGEGEGVEWG